MTGRPATAHVWSLLAAFVALIAVSALWIVNLRMGARFEGFEGGAMVITVPFGILLVVGAFLVLRAILHGRVRWRVVTVVVVSFAFALAPVIIYCGPVACFAPGSTRLMGWFLVGGAVLVALVHHFVLERFTPRTGLR